MGEFYYEDDVKREHESRIYEKEIEIIEYFKCPNCGSNIIFNRSHKKIPISYKEQEEKRRRDYEERIKSSPPRKRGFFGW